MATAKIEETRSLDVILAREFLIEKRIEQPFGLDKL
jgi:hypothetical protein